MNDNIEKLLAEAERQKAASTSSLATAERRFADDSEAEKHLARLKRKLLEIDEWNVVSGLMRFKLFDRAGVESKRETAAVGDFVRLSLTGTGKDDWVRISNIDESPDATILTVQPAYNPIENEPDKTVTSHFFTGESSNNFCLTREGAKIIVYVIGLNEKTNIEDTGGIVETVRNAATANLGHYPGIQESEWKLFCERFLELND